MKTYRVLWINANDGPWRLKLELVKVGCRFVWLYTNSRGAQTRVTYDDYSSMREAIKDVQTMYGPHDSVWQPVWGAEDK